MRGVGRGCTGPSGFEAFYRTESVRAKEEEFGPREEPFEMFIHFFLRDIKEEQPAVETRIQMRYPEVYAEIDRLKVEGELRLSIFWPLALLSVLLTWAWTPLAIMLIAVPPALLIDGYRRVQQATDKTWSVLTAGEVTSPILDALNDAKAHDIADYAEREGP